jgi:hypothetical protein
MPTLNMSALGAVILGSMLPITDLALSMRLILLVLEQPHPSPYMEPDASNTIMASSVRGGGFASSAPAS